MPYASLSLATTPGLCAFRAHQRRSARRFLRVPMETGFNPSSSWPLVHTSTRRSTCFGFRLRTPIFLKPRASS